MTGSRLSYILIFFEIFKVDFSAQEFLLLLKTNILHRAQFSIKVLEKAADSCSFVDSDVLHCFPAI